MSTQNAKEKSQLANYNYCLEVIEFKKNIEVAFLTLGERLKKIRDGILYQPSWTSFEEYLDEIKMHYSVASRLITVYENLVIRYGFKPELIANAGGWSNAYEITRIAKDKDDAHKWLTESAERTPKDTKELLREIKTGISQSDCKHRNTYTVEICKDCGIKMLKHEDNR